MTLLDPTKQDIITALNGGTPSVTPYTFYSWMADDLFSDSWKRLYDLGLGICHHVKVIREIQHGVEEFVEEKKIGSDTIKIVKKKTPVGTIQQTLNNGWHREYWLKTPEDYKVMTWITENTELIAEYEKYEQAEEYIGNYGVPIILGSRTPAMSINIDWAGTEQFCMDMALEIPEFFELYNARKKLFIEETNLIAQSPGRFVKWLENLTISMLGPDNYSKLLVSVYDECTPTLEKADKRVMVHYDGALKVIKNEIAGAPVHMIESLTEAPEGDMTYDECRQAWPDKVFWANINVDLYDKPKEVLQQAVIDKRNRAGKKGVLFEISEDLPKNYKDSIPVVLETLKMMD